MDSHQKDTEQNPGTEPKQCPPPTLTPREPRTQTLEETKRATREAKRVRARERDPREGVTAVEAFTITQSAAWEAVQGPSRRRGIFGFPRRTFDSTNKSGTYGFLKAKGKEKAERVARLQCPQAFGRRTILTPM